MEKVWREAKAITFYSHSNNHDAALAVYFYWNFPMYLLVTSTQSIYSYAHYHLHTLELCTCYALRRHYLIEEVEVLNSSHFLKLLL